MDDIHPKEQENPTHSSSSCTRADHGPPTLAQISSGWTREPQISRTRMVPPSPSRWIGDIFVHPLTLCLCRKTLNGPCASSFRTGTSKPQIMHSVWTGQGTTNVPPTLVRILYKGGTLKLPRLHKFHLDGDLGTPNFCTRTVSTHVFSIPGGVQISHACTMDQGGTPNPLDLHEFHTDIYRGTLTLHSGPRQTWEP